MAFIKQNKYQLHNSNEVKTKEKNCHIFHCVMRMRVIDLGRSEASSLLFKCQTDRLSGQVKNMPDSSSIHIYYRKHCPQKQLCLNM